MMPHYNVSSVNYYWDVSGTLLHCRAGKMNKTRSLIFGSLLTTLVDGCEQVSTTWYSIIKDPHTCSVGMLEKGFITALEGENKSLGGNI